MQGGVATRMDLMEVETNLRAETNNAETNLRAEIKALDSKVNIALIGIGLAALAPLIVRGVLGP